LGAIVTVGDVLYLLQDFTPILVVTLGLSCVLLVIEWFVKSMQGWGDER
jgi:hypothetical protein